MTLSFEASVVSCAEALGGGIFQVSFDTVPKSQDEENRRMPYVLISRNCEFPDPATIEWHDGQDYEAAHFPEAELGRAPFAIHHDPSNGRIEKKRIGFAP